MSSIRKKGVKELPHAKKVRKFLEERNTPRKQINKILGHEDIELTPEEEEQMLKNIRISDKQDISKRKKVNQKKYTGSKTIPKKPKNKTKKELDEELLSKEELRELLGSEAESEIESEIESEVRPTGRELYGKEGGPEEFESVEIKFPSGETRYYDPIFAEQTYPPPLNIEEEEKEEELYPEPIDPNDLFPFKFPSGQTVFFDPVTYKRILKKNMKPVFENIRSFVNIPSNIQEKVNREHQIMSENENAIHEEINNIRENERNDNIIKIIQRENEEEDKLRREAEQAQREREFQREIEEQQIKRGIYEREIEDQLIREGVEQQRRIEMERRRQEEQFLEQRQREREEEERRLENIRREMDQQERAREELRQMRFQRVLQEQVQREPEYQTVEVEPEEIEEGERIVQYRQNRPLQIEELHPINIEPMEQIRLRRGLQEQFQGEPEYQAVEEEEEPEEFEEEEPEEFEEEEQEELEEGEPEEFEEGERIVQYPQQQIGIMRPRQLQMEELHPINIEPMEQIRLRRGLQEQYQGEPEYQAVEEEPQEENIILRHVPGEELENQDIGRIRREALMRRGLLRELQQPQDIQSQQVKDQNLSLNREEKERIERMERIERALQERNLQPRIPFAYARPYQYDASQKFGTKKKVTFKEEEKTNQFKILSIFQDKYREEPDTSIEIASNKGMLSYQISKNSGPINYDNVVGDPFNFFIKFIILEAENKNNMIFKVGIDERYNINIGTLNEGIYKINKELQKISDIYYKQKLLDKSEHQDISRVFKKRSLNQNDYDAINKIFSKHKKLKWTSDQILEGSKEIKRHRFRLEDAINQSQYVKIKYLISDNNVIRLSNKYLFLVDIKDNVAHNYFTPHNQEFFVSEKFKRSINKFLFSDYHFDPYKCTRRMYYYSKFEYYKHGDIRGKETMEILSRFFQSYIPDIFEAYDRIKTLVLLKPNKKIVDATFKYIQNELSLDNIKLQNRNIEDLCKRLKKIIDEEALDFLENNELIPLPKFFIPSLIKYV